MTGVGREGYMTGVGRKGMHDQSGKEGHALPECEGRACLTGVGREGMHDRSGKGEHAWEVWEMLDRRELKRRQAKTRKKDSNRL